MIKTSVILFVIFYLVSAHSQQTIDKLNSNQLKLPKETISKALSIDATGQVKSSATSDVELGYLSGASSNVQDQIDGKANDADAVHLTGDESIAGVKTLTGKLVASSTVNASIPCPVMTQTQRDAIATPSVGDCVFNSDTSLSNIYDGALWKAMGGSGGGIGLWVTANGYAIDDVVIESNNIYICLTAHTSGTFATDLASLYWLRLSTDVTGATGLLPLATGGTNKSITPVDGSIIYSDTDSFELLGPGTSGQILQSNGSAAPSWGDETQYNVTNFLKTLTSSGALLETGNKNILTNPSFEHGTFDSGGWVNSAGSFTENFTFKIDGAKSARLVLSSQTMSLTQSSVLYQSNFADGVQGIATVRVKSNVALKVCSIRAGTVSTSNCVDVPNDNKWGLFKVPFILGATSNGISIASSGAVSGTVYIDDAFVGVTDIAQVSSAIGPWVTGVCTSTWTVNATTACKYRQVGDTAEVQYRVTLTGAPNATTLTFSTPNGLTIDTSKEFSRMGVTGSFITDISGPTYYPSFPYAASPTAIGVGYGTSSAGLNPSATVFNSVNNAAPMTFATGDEVVLTVKFPVTQFSGSVSTYSSPVTINADKIGEIIQTTNSTAPQGFISALNKSIGQTGSGATYTGQTYFALYEHLWSIAGLTTTAGDVYRISSAKGASASADFAANKTITIDYETNAPFIRGKASAAGVGAYTADTFQGHRHLIRGGGTGFTALGDNGLAAGATVISSGGALGVVLDPNTDGTNGTPRIGTETKPKNVSLNIFIRFAGDTQLITGSFNGLQTCNDTLACTDTFSASVSSGGIVSTENVNWVNGNASIATNYTLTYNSIGLTQGLNCTAIADNVGRSVRVLSSSASSLTVTVFNTLSQTATVDTGFMVVCQKQGADYIGKTAMAVASDQNVRSIGSTNVDIQSVYFGTGALCNTQCTTGNCTICGQVGSKITSIQFSSAGIYLVNGIDSTKYMCSGSGHTTVASVALSHARNAGSPTTQAVIEASGANVRNATFTCIGIP